MRSRGWRARSALPGDAFSAVGSDAAVLARRGAATRGSSTSAGGRWCPGFIDTHAHMDREGLKARGGYSLAGRHSVASIVEAVASACARTPKGEWAVFMPMGTPKLAYISRPDQLEEGRFPTRHDLDAVSPDNPVYIRVPWGWWVHRPFVAVANSAALRLCGIDRDTPAALQRRNPDRRRRRAERRFPRPLLRLGDRVHPDAEGAADYLRGPGGRLPAGRRPPTPPPARPASTRVTG